MLTIRYKGVHLARKGSRVKVFKPDGDVLGVFTGWTKAMTFVDQLKPGKAVPTIAEWEDARDGRALHG